MCNSETSTEASLCSLTPSIYLKKQTKPAKSTWYMYVSTRVRSCTCSFHLSPTLCPSTAGCRCRPLALHQFLPLSSNAFLFHCVFPTSLLCRLAIFCLIVPMISSLSLMPLCAAFGLSVYCSSFLLKVRPFLFQCVSYNSNIVRCRFCSFLDL